MKEIKVVSFDLDGTLTDSSFANSVWLEEIPKLYAIKNKISINSAKREVYNNYNKIGNKRIDWYNITFWLERFNLDIPPIELIYSCKNKICLFDDVIPILNKLKSKKRLIIISNARREFMDLEIKQTEIGSYFENIFSATSDFNSTKNAPKVYINICKILKVSPSEMVHIGDDYKFDFEVPNKLGINSLFLDRNAIEKRKFVVKSLDEISIK
ncbi:MAG: HAD family hydrolase [Candidatus Lokiarchaeota archaeon]|nr:HAD family hydrolase [Candidatus Lokiarchaeota archaeon]MCJ7713291.1 HAD family hydrolase [Candidatus Bathyarchaeota archaeon]